MSDYASSAFYAQLTFAEGLLMFCALIPVLLWCSCLIRLTELRICKKESFAAAAAAAVSFGWYDAVRLQRFGMPLPFLIGGFAVQILLPILTFRFIRRKSRTQLSAMSFKEGFDTLPAGLCFYLTGGMSRMVNYKMDTLFFQLKGEHLSNAEEFFRDLTDCRFPGSISGGEQPIISQPDGTAYSFTHNVITVNGEPVHELIASDITELYGMTKNLEEKQKTIRQINTRLKALNSTIRYVIMEKEVLTIKTRIHDQLGQTLLLSRRYLQEPAKVDAEEMLSQWKKSFGLLLHEERETWQKPYRVNIRQAELLGIRLEIIGSLPEEEHLIPVIDAAITVHTTNVMRHADGRHAEIRVEEQPAYYFLYFTNDGRPPQNGVSESGGLSNLRRMVERIGGGMKIRSLPAFELILKLPKQEKVRYTVKEPVQSVMPQTDAAEGTPAKE